MGEEFPRQGLEVNRIHGTIINVEIYLNKWKVIKIYLNVENISHCFSNWRITKKTRKKNYFMVNLLLSEIPNEEHVGYL